MAPKLPKRTVTQVGPPDAGAFYVFRMKPLPKERERAFSVRSRKTGKIISVNTKAPRTRFYEKEIGLAAEYQHPTDQPYECDLTAFISFFLPNRIHGDLDNLAKSVLDGLQSVAYRNDKQIKSLHLDLIFLNDSDELDKQPRTEVILMAHRNKPTMTAPASIPVIPDGELDF